MKRLISKHDERIYTYMLKLLNALGGRKLKYKWLITDIDAYPQDDELSNLLLSHEYLIVTTDILIDYLEKEDFQWVMGVFSAIPMKLSNEDILQYRLPDVTITERAFQEEPVIQHQLAEIEIDCVDSTYFQVVARDENLIENLKKVYPYISEEYIDSIELFVTKDRKKSSWYFEFQYCKRKDINKKNIITKLKDWLYREYFNKDSIYLYMEFFEILYRKYPYFKKTYTGDFRDWASNY